MNESIIYGLIIGAFSLIDLFQHNSFSKRGLLKSYKKCDYAKKKAVRHV